MCDALYGLRRAKKQLLLVW
jgi:MFS superfamily sulfate permease-like transporter